MRHSGHAQTPLHNAFGDGKLRTRIDTEDLFRVRQDDARLKIVGMGECHRVREIVFALGVVVTDTGK